MALVVGFYARSNPFSGLLRELRCVPTAPKSPDEQYAGLEASLHDFNVVALVLEQRCLPCNHLEIGIDVTNTLSS
jgi:hypothetical protein